jgi:chemotaxis signal transduction protein
MNAAVQTEELDLLLFEIGPNVFGADAALVLRIDRPDPETLTLSELGSLRHGARALVFRGPSNDGSAESTERSIRVDAVRGVQTVPLSELRRLPTAASADRYAIGVWLDGETPVMLIDLQETFSP